MEREDEGWRAEEIGCRGDQGSPRAVVPTGRQLVNKLIVSIIIIFLQLLVTQSTNSPPFKESKSITMFIEHAIEPCPDSN
jgi:hypothetical protein